MTRVEQLQQALAEAEADAMVLRLAENVLLATGYWVQIGGLGIAVVPREGQAWLLVPDYEEPEARSRFDDRPCRMRTHSDPSRCSPSCWR